MLLQRKLETSPHARQDYLMKKEETTPLLFFSLSPFILALIPSQLRYLTKKKVSLYSYVCIFILSFPNSFFLPFLYLSSLSYSIG